MIFDMLFKNSSKTLIAQIVLMSFLGAALFLPVTVADAGVTIFLQGQIEPASIDIALDTAALNLDIPTGETTATDTIAVSSTSYIPVEVTLEGVEHISGSWEPTLITGDPTSLEIADAQKKARLSLNLDPDNPAYMIPPAYNKVCPTGTGETVSAYTAGSYSPAAYPVGLGVITDTDGVASKSITIEAELNVSKKRILSKAFDSELIFNFSAANIE
jgi:hypothetical protein